jgi:transcriptional regulator with XRE-family HTH domain
MPKTSTKSAGNVYYDARMKAKSFNSLLSSREGAAEVTGISRDRIIRIEENKSIPYPEEVIIMAAEYNAPELKNWHCVNDCPIGAKTVPAIDPEDMSMLKFTAEHFKLKLAEHEIMKLVINTSESGEINKASMPLLKQVADYASKFHARAQALMLMAEKSNI